MERYFHVVIIVWCCAVVVPAGARICDGDVRIRGNMTDIDKLLKGCTVINGILGLEMLEGAKNSEEMFRRHVYPELLEVKDFVLVYRTPNLLSFGAMFPNLRLIFGRQLFEGFALIFFETGMKEIALTNLKKIERGNVYIGGCTRLCYAQTVNWNQLGTDLVYKEPPENPDYDYETCGICPSTCEDACWSSTQCQSTFNVTDCYWDDGNCVSKCPVNKYPHYLSKYCLTKEQCFMERPDHYFIMNNTCTNKCPRYFKNVTALDGNCVYCGDKCYKLCQVVYANETIHTQSDIERLSDCTHINGSLRFKIEDEKLVAYLYDHLVMIREITGLLKIVNSPVLQNLTFLKGLEVIHGRPSQNSSEGNNTLLVHQNANLEKLWDVMKVRIGKGRISFHDNQKLCMSVIEELDKFNNLNDTNNPHQVSRYSNGDQSACNVVTLIPEIEELKSTNVTLKWSPDSGGNIAYLWYYVYYKEVTTDGDFAEVCEVDNWSVVIVDDNEKGVIKALIKNLKPFTNYTYYILINTNTSDSSLTFMRTRSFNFTTLSDDPSGPTEVRAISHHPNSIIVSWNAPDEPQGILNHYSLIGYSETDDVNFVDQRNYCKKSPVPVPQEVKPITIKNDTCPPCHNKNADVFEFFCSNFLEEKNSHCSHTNFYQYDAGNITLDKRGEAKTRTNSIEKIVPANETSIVIENLEHYTMYVFLLSACNKNKFDRNQCSEIVMTFNRTKSNIVADNIPDILITIEHDNNVTFTWQEPLKPNGVIVSYIIEYRPSDVNSMFKHCITRQDHIKAGNKFKTSELSAGEYVVEVQAYSLAGPSSFPCRKKFTIDSKTDNLVIGIVLACIFFIVVIFILGAYLFYRNKKRREHEMLHLITNVNPDYAGTVYVEDEWEVSRSDLEINKPLGSGTFGMVFQGFIKSRRLQCAVKTVNDSANAQDKNEFLNEASIMKAFSEAHHVVKILGVISRGEPPFVIMEIMLGGDLKNFLRKSRDSSQSITSNEMFRMAIEIADGMAYLAAKKFVHRDLAARNCMVSADRTVKIGDFGMARDIYETDYYRKESKGLLPVRWMAPESLADGVFTSDSDAWSYGVVLWEMSTLAEQPYQGLSNEQVLEFVKSHGILERPTECPDLLFGIMQQCWKWHPNHRPLFTDIVKKLENHVGENFRLVSFFHSLEGQEYRLNSGERPNNPPAMPPETDIFARYNVSDEDLSLYSSDHNHMFHSYVHQRPNHLSDYRLSDGSPSRYSSFPLSPNYN